MLGGYGYMEEYPLARLLRDSRLGPIGGNFWDIEKKYQNDNWQAEL
jgi:alkylation response protein AidB-like acyl-CoA dehydrogenase